MTISSFVQQQADHAIECNQMSSINDFMYAYIDQHHSNITYRFVDLFLEIVSSESQDTPTISCDALKELGTPCFNDDYIDISFYGIDSYDVIYEEDDNDERKMLFVSPKAARKLLGACNECDGCMQEEFDAIRDSVYLIERLMFAFTQCQQKFIEQL